MDLPRNRWTVCLFGQTGFRPKRDVLKTILDHPRSESGDRKCEVKITIQWPKMGKGVDESSQFCFETTDFDSYFDRIVGSCTRQKPWNL